MSHYNNYGYNDKKGTMINPRTNDNVQGTWRNTSSSFLQQQQQQQREQQYTDNEIPPMSNREISNTTMMLHRYRTFDETQYASVPEPLSSYRNRASFHALPVKSSTYSHDCVVVDQHSYHPQHLSISMKRENFVEMKEHEDDRRRHEQKWSADDDIREESCHGSGTLIARMAKQTRPRRNTNDESNNISLNNVDGAKFEKGLFKRGQFPQLLYHILMNAESMKYSDIISFMPDGRAFVIYDKAKFEEMVIPRFFAHKSVQSFTS